MQTNDKANYLEGAVILINKPLTWTSFDVVRKIRNITKAKIGHAGTLDPLATGLLICCTGKMTKKINEYQAQEKEYTGTFTLGATTPTFDKESEPENFKDISHLTPEAIVASTNLLSVKLCSCLLYILPSNKTANPFTCLPEKGWM